MLVSLGAHVHLPRGLLAQGASVKSSRVGTWHSVTLGGRMVCWGGTGGEECSVGVVV